MQPLPDMNQLLKLASSPAGQKLLSMLQNDFLEWIEDQPVYSALPGQKTGMCYNINHFLQYLNAVLLADSSERAYCLTHGKTGKMPVIAF